MMLLARFGRRGLIDGFPRLDRGRLPGVNVLVLAHLMQCVLDFMPRIVQRRAGGDLLRNQAAGLLKRRNCL